MSILLDALRKSERQERLGAVPDIHGSDFLAEHRRPRWFWPAVGALVLALVLLAGWLGWQAWTWYDVPVAPPELTRNDGPATPAEATAAAASAGVNPAPAPETLPIRLDTQPRSPVESLSGERPHQAAPRPGAPSDPDAAPSSTTVASGRGERPPANAAADDPAADIARDVAALESSVLDGRSPNRAAPRKATGAGTESTRRTGSGAPAAGQADPVPAAGDTPAAAQAAITTDDTGLISYWQLPQERRADLPAFKINVMAWDEQPAARFIIMGGKRYREGEQLTPRLLLQEVRRDRVVFQSGPYRFYVTR